MEESKQGDYELLLSAVVGDEQEWYFSPGNQEQTQKKKTKVYLKWNFITQDVVVVVVLPLLCVRGAEKTTEGGQGRI